MLIQLQIKDENSKFFIELISKLKNVVEEVNIIDSGELRIENEKSFDEMSDEERWEKFGNWEPSAKNMDMCCAYVMNKIDEENGEENYEAWQK